jgi:hypothetical protein
LFQGERDLVVSSFEVWISRHAHQVGVVPLIS